MFNLQKAVNPGIGKSYGGIPAIQSQIRKKKEEEEIRQTSIFPGFNKRQIEELQRMTKDLPFDEQIVAQNELYEATLPMIKAKEQQEERQGLKNQLYSQALSEKDQEQQQLMMAQLRLANFADAVRNKAQKELGYPINKTDEEIAMLEVEGVDNGQQLFTDYLNGVSDEFLYISGLKERPAEKTTLQKAGQLGKDIVGGAYDSATGGFSFIAENLAKGVGRIAEQLGADEEKVQGMVDTYLASLKDFSGEAMGADTESLVYGGTKMVGDIAQVAGGMSALKGTQAGAKVAQVGKEATTKGAKLLEKVGVGAENAGKIAKATGKIVGRAAEGALDMAMYDAIAEQEIKGEDIKLGAILGGGLPLAGIVAKGLGKASKSALSQILGATTGKGKAAIVETMEKAGRSKDFTKGMRGSVDINTVLENVKTGLDDFKNSSMKLYGDSYKKLLDKKGAISIKDIQNQFSKSLENSRIKITNKGLDFAQSTIQNTADQTNIKKIYDLMRVREDKTPAGLDALKRAIRDGFNFNLESSVTKKYVVEAINNISEKITKRVPEYAEMMEKYNKFKMLSDDITHALSVGSTKANKQTALTKLQRVFKDNQEFRREMLDLINKYSKDDVVGQLAGVQMSELLPGGIMKVFGGAGIGAASIGLLNPKFLAGLITMSPRAIGEIATVLNISSDVLTKAIQNANKLVPQEAKVIGTKALIDNK